MGYYDLSTSNSPKVNKYTSKIGILITLFNYLDFHIQIFIEAIINLERDKCTTKTIIYMVRSFSFPKRVEFLKSLVGNVHKDKFNDYIKIHEEVLKCNDIRNNFAHSQIYFWDDPKGTHMFMSNMKKSIPTPVIKYLPLSIVDLDRYIERFNKITEIFHKFTYELGYFQC